MISNTDTPPSPAAPDASAKTEGNGYSRRSFLKTLGAGTVLASFAGTPLLRNFAQAATTGASIESLRANDETHKYLFMRGRYSYLRDIIYSAMPKVFGSPNGISHSAICAEAEKFGPYYTEGFWDYRDYDLENTRYVLCWGADPLASNRQVPHAINVWSKVREQAGIAVIDPRLSATAAKADH